MDEKQHKIKFAALIEQAGVIYDKQIDRLTLEAYWAALKHMDINVLEQAMTAHICREKWFPKPCELLEFDTELVAANAWNLLQETVQRVGAYKSVAFADPRINACVRHLGGWPAVCAMKESDETWRRKEFVHAFAMYSKCGCEGSESKPLPGLFKSQKIVQVGGPALLQGRTEHDALIEAGINVDIKRIGGDQ